MRVTRHDIPQKLLPTGHQLSTPMLVVEGDRPGPKVYIQSGNHGGELAGHGAIWELCRLLRDETIAGTIHLLPMVNPVSVGQRVGDWQVGVYDLGSGSNWNRVFKLLTKIDGRDPSDPRVDVSAFASRFLGSPWDEVRLAFKAELRSAVAGLRDSLSSHGLDHRDAFALSLQEVACDADLVLDLHTGDVAPRYLYVPPWCPDEMAALDIAHILVLDERFAGAMDEATICPWLMLQAAFRDLGRAVAIDVQGYTVELGSLETLERDSMRSDAGRIVNFLRAHGVLPDRPRADAAIERRACAIGDYLSYVAPDSGLAVFEKGPGERVSAGDVVCRILSPGRLVDLDVGAAETPVVAAEDGILVTRAKSPVVHRGLVLFKLMTRVQSI